VGAAARLVYQLGTKTKRSSPDGEFYQGNGGLVGAVVTRVGRQVDGRQLDHQLALAGVGGYTSGGEIAELRARGGGTDRAARRGEALRAGADAT